MTYKLQEYFYKILLYLSIILYIFVSIGIFYSAPQYLELVHNIMKTYVSLFLMIRFNPFSIFELTNFDKQIAFGAGLTLFGSTALNEFLKRHAQRIII